MQKETHKFHIDIKIYKKECIQENLVLLESDDLSGIIHVKNPRFMIDFLSVAPQPMQNTIFRAHDDHVTCVDFDTHIIVLHNPAKQENIFRSNTNGL